MSKGLQIAIGAAAVALLLGGYAATNLDALGSFAYYQTLEEFRAEATPGERVRVHGYVAPGTIERDLQGQRVRFVVQGNPPHAGTGDGGRLAVVYGSLETPDLFQDAAEVVVEGRLTGRDPSAEFEADNVLAKCPSKFQAEKVEQAGF